MTDRVKRLFHDSQEVKYFGTFQTEGETPTVAEQPGLFEA